MRKFFPQILLLFSTLLVCLAKRYGELNYYDIIAKMTDLPQKYPRFCKLFDVRKEYSHLIDTYCGKTLCEHWYLQITDFSLPEEKINSLPQVLFLAGIHGDEVLGPNIVISLAEHLLQKNEEDEDITRLIKSRVIILLPMANPSGFALKKREERQANGRSFDPNRDFPYNIKNSQCLRTSCARVINHIFRKYLIQAAITFHGGMQMIGYPWGAFNHIKGNGKHQMFAEECPDDRAFADIANILSKSGGSNTYLQLKPYNTGKMTDTVYAVDGGMEDWAYSASWEPTHSPGVISKCEESSSNVPIDPMETTYGPQSVRTLVYLIETADSKAPSPTFLGSPEGLDEGSTDKYAYGHIPINIKICLALADMLEPYVRLVGMDYSEYLNTLTVQWQGGGCKEVDMTALSWTTSEQDAVLESESMNGPGYYENSSHVFKQVINLPDDFNMSFTIKLTCDQAWGIQVDPKPALTPQTHVVQSRLRQDYYAESNGFTVSGKKIVELQMDGITKDYLLRTRINDAKELLLTIEFFECSSFVRAGTLNMQLNSTIKDSVLQITGNLNVEDSFLEGHLHEYGDMSRCLESAGKALSISDFASDEVFNHSLMFTMQKDDIKTVKIDYPLPMRKNQDVISLIGKSIVLEKKSHPDKLYVGQIVPSQPLSCKKSFEMKNCIGTDLGSQTGICILNMPLDMDMHEFKLFIEPGPDRRSVNIRGFLPTTILDRYSKFEELFIINEKTEKKFLVKQRMGTYGFIESSSFNLYPQIALGNLLRVSIQNGNDRLSLGDCTIALKDPSFDEVLFIMQNTSTQQQEKASALRSQLLLLLLICIFLIIVGLILFFVLKRYRRMKKQNFEVAMSARKERYADTARMISTARGVASARTSGGGTQGVVLSSGREPSSTSSRTGFTLFGHKGTQGASKARRNEHIELQENSEEESR